MDDSHFNFDELHDVESTAGSSKDRSDSARFVEILQAARHRNLRKPSPPVQLSLSEEARKRVEERGEQDDTRADEDDGKTPDRRRTKYPRPGERGESRAEDTGAAGPPDGDSDHG